MHRRRWAVLGTAALIALSAAGCGKSATDNEPEPKATENLSPTTPAAKGSAGPLTWSTYREVGTLDPIQAFDYPENTVITVAVRLAAPAAARRLVQAGPGLEGGHARPAHAR